jgi:hypothetical protein
VPLQADRESDGRPGSSSLWLLSRLDRDFLTFHFRLAIFPDKQPDKVKIGRINLQGYRLQSQFSEEKPENQYLFYRLQQLEKK